MSENKAIDPMAPPTSPPWSVDETAPSYLNATSDTVMAEVDIGVSIDQPPPPLKEMNQMLNLFAVAERGENYPIRIQLKIYLLIETNG